MSSQGGANMYPDGAGRVGRAALDGLGGLGGLGVLDEPAAPRASRGLDGTDGLGGLGGTAAPGRSSESGGRVAPGGSSGPGGPAAPGRSSGPGDELRRAGRVSRADGEATSFVRPRPIVWSASVVGVQNSARYLLGGGRGGAGFASAGRGRAAWGQLTPATSCPAACRGARANVAWGPMRAADMGPQATFVGDTSGPGPECARAPEGWLCSAHRRVAHRVRDLLLEHDHEDHQGQHR